MKNLQTKRGQLTIDFLISIILFGGLMIFAIQSAIVYSNNFENSIQTTQTTNEHITDLLLDKVEENGINYIRTNSISKIKNDLEVDKRKPLDLKIIVKNKSGDTKINKGVNTDVSLSSTSKRVVYSKNNGYRIIKVKTW